MSREFSPTIHDTVHRKPQLIKLIIIGVLIVWSAGCASIPKSQTDNSPLQAPVPTTTMLTPNEEILIATVNALSTEIARVNPVATAEAFATQMALSEINESAAPVEETPAPINTITPTEGRYGPDNSILPEGIPIPDKDVENFYSTSNFVSYATKHDIQSLTQFYITQMTENSWTNIEEGTYISENDALLNFEKPDRTAIVSIQFNPLSKTVTVVITIRQK